MIKIFDTIFSMHFLEALGMLIFMLIVLRIIKFLLKTQVDRYHKVSTISGIVFSILQYIVILVTIFCILSIYGVNITGLLAGVGIVATIVGLALQDSLKDIFHGVSIYSNNFYKVNDVVKYNDELCEVKYFNARVTKFRSLYTNSTYTVPNSSVGAIEKIKDNGLFWLTFPFAEDHEKIMDALKDASEEMKKINDIEDAYPGGCMEVTPLGNRYLLYCIAKPKDAFAHCGELNEALIQTLKKHDLAPLNEKHLLVDSFEYRR